MTTTYSNIHRYMIIAVSSFMFMQLNRNEKKERKHNLISYVCVSMVCHFFDGSLSRFGHLSHGGSHFLGDSVLVCLCLAIKDGERAEYIISQLSLVSQTTSTMKVIETKEFPNFVFVHLNILRSHVLCCFFVLAKLFICNVNVCFDVWTNVLHKIPLVIVNTKELNKRMFVLDQWHDRVYICICEFSTNLCAFSISGICVCTCLCCYCISHARRLAKWWEHIFLPV